MDFNQSWFNAIDTQIQFIKEQRKPIIQALLLKGKELRHQIHWSDTILGEIKSRKFLMTQNQLNIEESFIYEWGKNRNKTLFLEKTLFILINNGIIQIYNDDGKYKALIDCDTLHYNLIVELIHDFFLQCSSFIMVIKS